MIRYLAEPLSADAANAGDEFMRRAISYLSPPRPMNNCTFLLHEPSTTHDRQSSNCVTRRGAPYSKMRVLRYQATKACSCSCRPLWQGSIRRGPAAAFLELLSSLLLHPCVFRGRPIQDCSIRSMEGSFPQLFSCPYAPKWQV